jgi:hypothetical protein
MKAGVRNGGAAPEVIPTRLETPGTTVLYILIRDNSEKPKCYSSRNFHKIFP